MKKLTKKRGFSLIELMFVMLTISALASIAIPNFATQILSENFVKIENDLKSAHDLTKKIRENNYDTPKINFSTSKSNKIYKYATSTLTYKYVFSVSNLDFTQVKIFNEVTNDYSEIGIILDTRNLYKKSCIVFNSATDSEYYWTNDCTLSSLGWDYE